MHFLQEAKKWLGEITEIALLLVALGVAFEILLGPGFLLGAPGIVANLTGLIEMLRLGENGLVGLIALAVIVWLFYRKRVPA